jgi:hypothetical protein
MTEEKKLSDWLEADHQIGEFESFIVWHRINEGDFSIILDVVALDSGFFAYGEQNQVNAPDWKIGNAEKIIEKFQELQELLVC